MAFRVLQCVFMVLVCFSTSNGVLETRPERDILFSFKNSLENPEILSSWSTATSHCEWQGVSCEEDDRVVSLVLSTHMLRETLRETLRGPISTSIFSLETLTVLDLSANQFYGEIPSQIASLNRLKILDLGRNQLNGELPSELGKLTQLQTLRLGSNSFTGKIPSEIGNLVNLSFLDLSGNSLTGKIPPHIGNLSQLHILAVGNNFLSGSLSPSLFTKLQSLSSFDVSNNSLSSTIPPEIGKLTSLTKLYLGNNQFYGQFPAEIGNLSKLEVFLSPSCSFNGPIPQTISKLKSLSNLDLSDNPLECSIPNAIGELQNLTILNLVNADLNGTIPSELENCKNLRFLVLSFNSLSGILPEELSELPLITFSAENNDLSGPLPSWLGKWTQVDSILLSNNQFSSQIPAEIGNCSLLTQLSLSSNMLTGEIPKELCNAISLAEIELAHNFLIGNINIDRTFAKCSNLSQLILLDNQLIGSIPDYLSNLPLMVLELDFNNFTGVIPSSLWSSLYLTEFSASSNHLEGNLMVEKGNAVSVEIIDLSNNRLSGTLPKEIGKLTSLSVLNLNSNFLEGPIPNELGNCTALTTLDLGNNSLNGSIPEELSRLSQLQCLVLSHNNLHGKIPSKGLKYFNQINDIPYSSYVQHHGVYDLSFNKLSGSIPEELGSCLVIVDLLLSNNMLSGEIPRSLSWISNLTTLDLSGNFLAGNIPQELGDSVRLQGLYLGNNKLTGSIPESLGRLSSLVKLNLTANMLTGLVPSSFGNLIGLTHLDLSSNGLSSSLDGLFKNLIMWRVEIMNLSCNSFTGFLPKSFGNMSCLSELDLHRNGFTGNVPPEFGSLDQLEYLDISGNKLSGQIPDQICGAQNLVFLDFSDNRLEGLVPSNGICSNFTKASLSGNKNLCGGIVGLRCPLKSFARKSSMLNVWSLISTMVGTVLITLSAAIAIRICVNRGSKNDPEEIFDSRVNSSDDQNLYLSTGSRSKEPLSINIATFEQPLTKLTSVDIIKATDNFSKANIIGDGGFGTVYKATLPCRKTVAVKKLSQAKAQGQREFIAEMETLGKVKHRNLVPLFGYCSYGEEKILVYEYMVNGSLDRWLRNHTGNLDILDWSKRFKIALGAARGLAFLHHGFIPHIIHRDMKASNILLNEDFEAKVADFGLARLISACETHVSTEIAGTFGYIPPEYGQSWKATTRGDVYSFGVILLELLTGKEPTGPEFKDMEGGNLVGWVQQKIKNCQAVDVFDLSILDADSKQMMLKTLQIAVVCLSENPASRPTMFHVLKLLKEIKDE